METLHEDFLAVDEAHRWTGALPELYDRLRSEAKRVSDQAENPYAWRVLPRGARVGMRTREKDWPRCQLVISRKQTPADPRRWAQEVQTFVAQFGIQHWQPTEMPQPKQGVLAAFVELYAGEVAIGFTKCQDCPELIPYEPAFAKTNRCTACAIEAGRREQVAQASSGPLFDGVPADGAA